MTNTKSFTVGFAFSEDKKEVVLIKEKLGLYGVGGLTETGWDDQPHNHIQRVFEEETSVKITKWDHFATVYHDGTVIYVLRTFNDLVRDTIQTERARLYPVVRLQYHTLMLSVDYLIELALDESIRSISITKYPGK